jgi:hypothetical protein
VDMPASPMRVWQALGAAREAQTTAAQGLS